METTLTIKSADIDIDLTNNEIWGYKFQCQAVNSQYAKSNHEEYILEVTGDISRIIEITPEALETLRAWAKKEYTEENYYQPVTVKQIYMDTEVRSITFTQAGIKKYSEKINPHTGHGYFTISLAQKIDAIAAIKIERY